MFFKDTKTLSAPEKKRLSGTKREAIAESKVEVLKQCLCAEDAKAQVAQSDPLEAISIAAQYLSSRTTGVRRICVCDTGIGTTGYLNMAAANLLAASPENVTAALKEACALPSLNGCQVFWSFMGEVAAPQKPLNKKQLANLRNIWTAVLEAGGASRVELREDDFAANEPFRGLPPVSVVSVEPTVLDVEIETEVLDNASVQFKGDTAELIDRDKAVAAVRGIAEQLLAHPDCRILVAGCTAGGKPEDFCKTLSEDRAAAVRDLLCEEYGVSGSQIDCVGLGFHDPWHIDDLNGENRQIEDLAARNRKVVVMDVNSADAALVGETP